MSAHLLIVAGYLELPQGHKLVMMKVCDSADDRTRVGHPGMDAIRAWSGLARSQALKALADLQEWGLLMQTETGNRGRRAAFKVFPEPGEGARSVAGKKGLPCPGVDLFKGSPGIPDAEEVAALIAAKVPVPRKPKGSVGPDPLGGEAGVQGGHERQPKGPVERTQSDAEGSGPADPMYGERVRLDGPFGDEKGSGESEKGSDSNDKGSDGPDPFGTNLPTTTTTTKPLAEAGASTSDDGLFDAAPVPKPRAARKARAKTTKVAKQVDPVIVLAQKITKQWWDPLYPKPLGGNDNYRNVMLIVANAIRGGRDAETEVLPALIDCGVAVTQRALDLKFEMQKRNREGMPKAGQRPVSAGFHDSVDIARRLSEREQAEAANYHRSIGESA